MNKILALVVCMCFGASLIAQATAPRDKESLKKEEFFISEVGMKTLGELVTQNRDAKSFFKRGFNLVPKADQSAYKELFAMTGPFPTVSISGRVFTFQTGAAKLTLEFPATLNGDVLLNGKPWKRNPEASLDQEYKRFLASEMGKKVSVFVLLVNKAHASGRFTKWLSETRQNWDRKMEVAMAKTFIFMNFFNFAWDAWIKPFMNGTFCAVGAMDKKSCGPENACLRNGGEGLETFGPEDADGSRIRYLANYNKGKLESFSKTKVDKENKTIALGTEVFFGSDNMVQSILLRETKDGEPSPTTVPIQASTSNPDHLVAIEKMNLLATELRNYKVVCDKDTKVTAETRSSNRDSAPRRGGPAPAPAGGGR